MCSRPSPTTGCARRNIEGVNGPGAKSDTHCSYVYRRFPYLTDPRLSAAVRETSLNL